MLKRFILDTGRDEKLILRLTSLGVPLRLCGDASLFRQVRNLRVRQELDDVLDDVRLKMRNNLQKMCPFFKVPPSRPLAVQRPRVSHPGARSPGLPNSRGPAPL